MACQAKCPASDGLKALLETKLFPAFPDGQWINEKQIAEGEKVVTRFTFYGTHQGTFMGIPPTGRRVAVGGVVIDLGRQGFHPRPSPRGAGSTHRKHGARGPVPGMT